MRVAVDAKPAIDGMGRTGDLHLVLVEIGSPLLVPIIGHRPHPGDAATLVGQYPVEVAADEIKIDAAFLRAAPVVDRLLDGNLDVA